jgi:hypothetical protein
MSRRQRIRGKPGLKIGVRQYSRRVRRKCRIPDITKLQLPRKPQLQGYVQAGLFKYLAIFEVLRGNGVFPKQALEATPLFASHSGRPGNVSLASLQDRRQIAAFALGDCGGLCGLQCLVLLLGLGAAGQVEVGLPNCCSASHNNCPLQHRLQLAHVAGPMMTAQPIDG